MSFFSFLRNIVTHQSWCFKMFLLNFGKNEKTSPFCSRHSDNWNLQIVKSSPRNSKSIWLLFSAYLAMELFYSFQFEKLCHLWQWLCDVRISILQGEPVDILNNFSNEPSLFRTQGIYISLLLTLNKFQLEIPLGFWNFDRIVWPDNDGTLRHWFDKCVTIM